MGDMATLDSADVHDIHDASLVDETVALVSRWLDAAAELPTDPAAAQLAALLKDPEGLSFTVRFVDLVIRPEDVRVAAANLADLAGEVPGFLPAHLRAALRLGGHAGRIAPGIVIPVARAALRRMVGHLLIDATDKQLTKAIARTNKPGVTLNINLLGEAVLGRREATRRLRNTQRLLARPDVDYVSIKVSSTIAPHSPWAFDEAVQDVVERLTPLYEQAAAASPNTFINLDMEEYRDLELTMEVFQRILDQPHLRSLQAGIVLQAYLPDALDAMQRIQAWAAERVSNGGAPVKVRVVKGANLPMERTEAALHGWPVATWPSKRETDTNFKRVLAYALQPERVKNVRIGVAGHNLFDVAHAWLLAGRRGVRDGMDVEMLLGMAQQQAEVVRREVGGLVLYTPVVHPGEFDVAISYLVRRLEEGASQDNFMSAVFDLDTDRDLFEREKQRFLDSLAAVDADVPQPNRRQDRREPAEPLDRSGFANTPDTDTSLLPNLSWGKQIRERAASSELGLDLVAAATVEDPDELDSIVARTHAAAPSWGERSGAERASVLQDVADMLQERRGELLEVMAAETGKTLEQADPEVSEAIDFARYYAQLARELDDVDGARPTPTPLTLVTPPWNFPVAIPAGSTLAALASGSAVIIKPAPQAQRCGSVLVQALWDAGVPREVLSLVHVSEGDLGRQLVEDERVGRVILTGGYATAELFRSFRPDLPLLAETSGKNSLVITPSADIDLAVRDLVASAFGHAGQKCSAASLVILVGAVGRSERFRRQLMDATGSLTVGWPEEATTQMGPIIEPATGKLHDALTTLDPGEWWMRKPQQLDETGRLWTPGIREGVKPGSTAHLVEFFGPMLGIMRVDTLAEAIEVQNAVEYGLTAGLHSLDPKEIDQWLASVEAGNVYVNRGITGAIVQRQPFGGWKKSAVGAGTKAGGPNYLIGLVDWHREPATASTPIGAAAERLVAAASAQGWDVDGLRRAFASDAEAWSTRFGGARDVTGLEPERNLLRYVPATVHIRLGEQGDPVDLVRVLGAAERANASCTVSVPSGAEMLADQVRFPVVTESDAAWTERLAAHPPAERIRTIGVPRGTVEHALGGRPDVAVYDQPVTESGRVELLPFLQEQALCITAHRFGSPDPMAHRLHVDTRG